MTGSPGSLQALLAEHLTAELGDAGMAQQLAEILADEALTWRAPSIPLGEVRTIIAFTFGNRMLPSGNREPGPVNAALADMAVRLHEATGAPVWAQWEVAEAVADRLPEGSLAPVYPERDAQGEPRYLSTGLVTQAVIERGGGAAALGGTAVVACRDHAWRSVRICRRFGLTAGVPDGWPMPELYDTASGQPWTRDRLAYLLHDLHCRALDRRDEWIRDLGG